MMNRELAGAWMTWCSILLAAQNALSQLRRGLLYMINRDLASSFAKWLEMVSIKSHELRERQARRRLATNCGRLTMLRRPFVARRKSLERMQAQHAAERIGQVAGEMLCCGAKRALLTWASSRLRFSKLTARKGLRLRRAAQSLGFADVISQRFHHWRAMSLLIHIEVLKSSVHRVSYATSDKLRNAEKHGDAMAAKLQRQEALTKTVVAKCERVEAELESTKTKLVREEAHRISTLTMLKSREAEAAETAEKFEKMLAQAEAANEKLRLKEEKAREELRRVSTELEATSATASKAAVALAERDEAHEKIRLREETASEELKRVRAELETASSKVAHSKSVLTRSEAQLDAMSARCMTAEADARTLRAELQHAHAKELDAKREALESQRQAQATSLASQADARSAKAEAEQSSDAAYEAKQEAQEAKRQAQAVALEAKRLADARVKEAEERVAVVTQQEELRSRAEGERIRARSDVEAKLEVQAAQMHSQMMQLANQLVESRKAHQTAAQGEAASNARAVAMEHELNRLRLELSSTTGLAVTASAATASAAATAAAQERCEAELDAERRHNHVLEKEAADLRNALARLSTTASPLWTRGWEHGVRDDARSPRSPRSPLKDRSPDRLRASPVPLSPAYSFGAALPMPALTDAARLLDTRLEELRRFVSTPVPPSRHRSASPSRF